MSNNNNNGQMELIKRNAAATLAHYSGKTNQEQFVRYDGKADPFVYFDGEPTDGAFTNEMNSTRSFVFTFDTMTAVADVEVILFPGIIPSTGLLIAGDGLVGGGQTGFQPVTFTGSPVTLRALQEWVKWFPTRLVGMQLTSANILQHSTSIDIYNKTPYRKGVEPRTIYLAHHANEYKNQLTITTVKENFQLDAKKEIRINLKKETTGSFILFFGAMMDTAEALNQKAKAAGAITSA